MCTREIVMLDKYIKTKTFSYVYSAIVLSLAVGIILIGWDGYNEFGIVRANHYLYKGIQLLVLIASAMLVVSSRLTDAMLPAMLLVVIATACYNSADKFTAPGFIWVAVPAVFAVIFHFIKYRKPFKVGSSFFGLCAVTLAVTLGGVGRISASDYFSGTSLFYVFGLGIGMVAFYLLVKSQSEGDTPQSIARIMYMVGMLAAFSIFWLYVSNWDTFIESRTLLQPQFGNNLSTLLMMALPFPLYYATKRYGDFLAAFVMYAALIMSGSMGGLIMGTVEFVALLILFSVFYQKGIGGIVRRVLFLGTLVATVTLVWYYLPSLAKLTNFVSDENVSRTEVIRLIMNGAMDNGASRMKLFSRMVDDFKSNPIFGVGIGYTGNTDIYNPVKGAMNWYHMWLAQVVGSLGIVGICAYGYQLVGRVRLFIRSRSFMNFTLLMSYVGLFLMSQVNPGEFCPAPYAMLAVTYFAYIERKEDDVPIGDLFKKFSKKHNQKNTAD